MTIGSEIARYRKEKGMTQEALAQTLGVTNQAVSKWESDQNFPDVTLLPRIADLFEISLDTLFGREFRTAQAPSGAELPAAAEQVPMVVDGLPWRDDRTLRVVIYKGHTLLKNTPDLRDITFRYEGEALNISSQISVSCGEVHGNVDAGTAVNCENVMGHVDAGTNVNCGNVEGNVDAGTDVKCGTVMGSVDAGCSVECHQVGGDVDAGTDVKCGDVTGDVDAGADVRCGDVTGDVDAGGNVECGIVHGDVDAGGKVVIRNK